MGTSLFVNADCVWIVTGDCRPPRQLGFGILVAASLLIEPWPKRSPGGPTRLPLPPWHVSLSPVFSVPASAFVNGRPRRAPRLSRFGAAGVVATLATRGGLGLAGQIDLIAPGSVSERFRARDRRFYSPLCITLAALSLPAVLKPA